MNRGKKKNSKKIQNTTEEKKKPYPVLEISVRSENRGEDDTLAHTCADTSNHPDIILEIYET